MDFSATAVQVGDRVFSVADLLVAAGCMGLLLLVLATFFAWRAGRARREEAFEAVRRSGELELRLADMAGQLRQFAEMSSAREARLDSRLDQVGQRLGQGLNDSAERTGQSLRHLHERLAVIDRAQQNITALSQEMVGLKDILSNKQARGAFGQGRMEAIVRDGLHASSYSFQATLSNGTRPDCLIRLPENDQHIVVDAKFPLEAFNAFRNAEDEAALGRAAQRLRQDMARHVRDISRKYLIPGETHDTAILFVPSESVYADIYEHFEDVVQKAHRARVIIASPNILMLMVQTMQAIFRDARMREQAGLVQKEVMHLLEDVERLRSRVVDLQRHFGQASQDIDKLLVSSQKIARRGARIEQLDVGDTAGPSDVDDEPGKPKLAAGR